MDGMKVVRLPQDRPRRTRVPQDRARQQRHRPREPDYPRKSSLPGMPGIAWSGRDPPPQRSASSDAPANQIARIAHRGVFTQPGSKREAAIFGLMSASAGCRHWSEEPACWDAGPCEAEVSTGLLRVEFFLR